MNITNAATSVLDTYGQHVAGSHEEIFIDLLADLNHWAHQHGEDFEHLVQIAHTHFEVEQSDTLSD